MSYGSVIIWFSVFNIYSEKASIYSKLTICFEESEDNPELELSLELLDLLKFLEMLELLLPLPKDFEDDNERIFF